MRPMMEPRPVRIAPIRGRGEESSQFKNIKTSDDHVSGKTELPPSM